MYIPPPPEQLPLRGNAFSHWLGRSLLRLLGWRFEGELPNTKKCLIIAAPHTSNWDFVIGMLAMLAIGLKASWIGKASIFVGPFRPLLVWAGGIPVVRNQNSGAVEQQVAIFQAHEKLVLGIAPEGTRSATTTWKKGFYHIAEGAGIPLFPIYWDYEKKVVGLLPLYHPTGDKDADIAKIQALFKDVKCKFPKNAQWQNP